MVVCNCLTFANSLTLSLANSLASVLPVLLHMVETKGKNLQDDFVEDFYPVLVVTFVAHNDEIVFLMFIYFHNQYQ